MDEFIKEIREMPTSDLMLIIEDQKELYTEEEYLAMLEELRSRPSNAVELEELEQERKEREKELEQERKEREQELEQERKEREQELARERKEAEEARQAREHAHEEMVRLKILKLKNSGHDGYWEYKVINLYDGATGSLNPSLLEYTLNEMGLAGWHLKCAYANELGQNASGNGFGGHSTGSNATIDQNILILERFVKL